MKECYNLREIMEEEHGWGRDGGLNKDFSSTSVGDFVSLKI